VSPGVPQSEQAVIEGRTAAVTQYALFVMAC
jgi:hypothetical protein